MKPWAEDNFLERLMPELRQQERVRTESCPDPELLTAFAEEQVTPFVRSAVTLHLSQCRDCSEICARLVNLARVGSAAQDIEWVNAEKRLGNWMGSFLQSRVPIESRAEAGTTLQKADSKRSRFFWGSQNLVGALAIAALAVVVAGGAFYVKRGTIASTPKAPVISVASDTQPALATPSRELTEQAVTQTPEVKTPVQTAAQAPAAKPGAGVQRAAAVPRSSVVAQASPQLSPRVRSNATPANENASSQDAHTFTPPQLNPNDRILADTGAGASAAARDAALSRAGLGTQSSTVASKPAASRGTGIAASPTLQLEPGVRLWVRLNSTAPQTDGSFTFRGSLTQPVEHSGAVALDRDALVIGSGTVQNGKTEVTISQLVVRGTSYGLKNGPETSGSKTPGTGTAVQFNRGKVLEMWLGTATIYEKLPDSESLRK